jgi:ABC-type transport system involved in cytochrome bd biosynthesis fused ATPase/permease subunit
LYERQRLFDESESRPALQSAAHKRLERGPQLSVDGRYSIPREDVVRSVMNIIEPAKESRFYPLIIGEDGTGKTSLIRLALEKLSEPKGVIYANYSTGSDFTETLQEALGWYPDKSGGGGKGNRSGSPWESTA